MPRDLRTLQTGRALRITRLIPSETFKLIADPTPEFTPGMVVYEYKGVTYGCIRDGVAVTLEPGVTPFHEVPWDAVEPVGGDE